MRDRIEHDKKRKREEDITDQAQKKLRKKRYVKEGMQQAKYNKMSSRGKGGRGDD